MEKFFKKLRHLIPNRPMSRFNTIAGSSNISELFFLIFHFFSRRKNAISIFEDKLSKLSGTKHVLSFGAGRMALYAGLEALEIEEGDEIIIPAFTCVVVANAILYRGATPIYVDIDSKDFNIDVSKIKKLISKKTRAIYAQHTFGVPCNIEALKRICEDNNLFLIEDAAHIIGVKINEQMIGSFGDISFFSFDHSKIINTYSGGAACTNNLELGKKLFAIQKRSKELYKLQKVKLIFSHFFEVIFFHPYLLWIGKVFFKILVKLKVIFSFDDQLNINLPSNYPFPCKFTNFQALIGIGQINNLDENLIQRKKINNLLNGILNLRGAKKDQLPLIRYSFLVKDRKKFEKKFHNRFDLQVWFTSVLHMRNDNLNEVKYSIGSCPIAEKVSRHIVNFPTHQRVNQSILKKEIQKNLIWIKNK